MSQTFETITVSKKEVSCDGGGGALGHPVIYLEMGEKTDITCPIHPHPPKTHPKANISF
jgi:uncharacterized Zn-finger protein